MDDIFSVQDHCEGAAAAAIEFPYSVHSRNVSAELQRPPCHLHHRQVSTVSIPIFFDNLPQLPLESEGVFEQTCDGPNGQADHDTDDLAPSPYPDLSVASEEDGSVVSALLDDLSLCALTSSLELRPSTGSMRRLSTASGLTMGSLSTMSSQEPATPSDHQFSIGPTESNGIVLESEYHHEAFNKHVMRVSFTLVDTNSSNATVHQRTGSQASTASAFTISEYYGCPDCSDDIPQVALETLASSPNTAQAAQVMPSYFHTPKTSRHLTTPPQGVAPSPCATLRQTALPRRITFKEAEERREKNSWYASNGICGVLTHSIEKPLASDLLVVEQQCNTAPTLALSQNSSEDNINIKLDSSPLQSRRRVIIPHIPLATARPAQAYNLMSADSDTVVSSSDITNNSSLTGSESVSPSLTMYQIIRPDQFFPSNTIHPLNPNMTDSYQFHAVTTPGTNSIPFHSVDKSVIHSHDNPELPVGELFRTLQIWFDQEGFREIAPVFTFDFYNRDDDLLYFTTERVGYPFHYDSMQQVPVLRKVVAPDYEEAYALLEGKSHRNAAGRRDFISRQAYLNMKTAGKYVVEDKEGKGGKWIWRLVYEVEERKSLMGKPMLGERAFFPITFACSPEILDPSHARKPSLFNSIIKNIGSKKTAVALDVDGRLTTRPRGKSLMGYHSRKRSDSITRLLRTPPRQPCQPHPPPSDSIPSADTLPSSRTSARSTQDDELSRAQAHFFKAIAPASASRLRPVTAFDEENVTKRILRKAKTNEQLRRPFTADAARSALPTRPLAALPIIPVFGMAPQPTRATPTTAGNKFQSRPKTADDRRPRTAKSPLDVRRIAAASFFTPASVSL